MKKVVFITPPDAEYGFRLSGLIQHIADKGELEGVLLKILDDLDIGLVIIDERLLSDISGDRRKEIESAWHGIIVILPSPEKPAPEVEDYAETLIRRAIGYHVRLNI